MKYAPVLIMLFAFNINAQTVEVDTTPTLEEDRERMDLAMRRIDEAKSKLAHFNDKKDGCFELARQTVEAANDWIKDAQLERDPSKREKAIVESEKFMSHAEVFTKSVESGDRCEIGATNK